MSYSRLNHVLPVLLTAKQLVGLVYVAIAVLAAGLAAVQTNGNVQWFYTAQSLDPYIGGVTFRLDGQPLGYPFAIVVASHRNPSTYNRSEEHTSELQSRRHLVCRLLLEI